MPGNTLAQVLAFSLYSSVIEQLVGLPVALLITFHIEENLDLINIPLAVLLEIL